MKFKLYVIIFLVALFVGTSISSGASVASEANGIVTLTAKNHAAISGPVTGESVAKVMRKLSDAIAIRGDEKYPIYLVLDTPGGSVLAGFRLHEFLKPYTNIKTITLNSYSMGAFLAEMIAGERLMVETGTLMFHRMRTTVQRATTEELDSQSRYSKSLEALAEKKVSERSGISVQELRKKFTEDWYMQAQEAIDNKLIDRIITVKCDAELLESSTTEQVQLLPFMPPIDVQVSNCPILL